MKPGQIVVLTGAGGGLGSFGIQYAKAMGMRVVAVDHISKEDHCRNLGAEWFVDAFDTPDIVAHIRKLTNGGAHGVVSFAAAKKPMEYALEYVRKRGTVVFVGLPKDGTVIMIFLVKTRIIREFFRKILRNRKLLDSQICGYFYINFEIKNPRTICYSGIQSVIF